MGTVLSIAQFKEEKNNAAQFIPAHEEDDLGAIVETGDVLDYEKLAQELGQYLPLALHHAHNLAVFRKTSSLGAMVQFELSTDQNTPTVIPVNHPGPMADVLGSSTVLLAIVGRTIRMTVDKDEYYVRLRVQAE